MNRQLERHLRRLGLDPSTPPDAARWASFLARMETAYADRDRERYLAERATRLASSELAAASEAAERKALELRTMIDALVEGICVVDGDAVIVSGNPAARWILGADPVGVPVAAAFADVAVASIGRRSTDSVAIADTLVAAIAAGEDLDVEHAVLTLDGHQHHLTIQVRPIPRQSMTVVAINDITSLIEAESTRSELERRVGQQQRLESIGRLAGSVAHDFNNLLAGILSCVELLEDDVTGESLDDVAEIRRAARRGADLTRRLLAFSRQETDEPVVIDVNAVITELSTLLVRLVHDRAGLETLLVGEPANVLIDPVDLEQIIMNLVVNARDAIDSTGRIVIETALVELDEFVARPLGVSPGSFVLLEVSDDGSGMPADVAARAIEPFFTTKRHGEGNGLGLATVHGLATRSGGALAIHSQVGRGTTVRIYLPTVTAARPTSAHSDESHPVRRLLIVDDEPSVLAIVERCALSLGYQTTTAASCQAARHLVTAGDYDAVLVDLVLDDGSGLDLATELLDHDPTTRIVVMSGFSERLAMVPPGLGIGFVEKPFGADLLRRVLESDVERVA